MSLRQFYPRKNMRRQVAGWKLFVLYATLVVAIGLQISYPLIEGEPLRVVTIATVYWAAAAMFLHAMLAYGVVYAVQFLFITKLCRGSVLAMAKTLADLIEFV
jgi:putative membrane protein